MLWYLSGAISHKLLCSFSPFWTKSAAYSGQRWENRGFVCSHYHFRPHHYPSHHISIHTITCVWVCISSFHLLNTHDYTVILVTSNFCFPNYVCYSCLPMEKESRWISAFIITPISPWAVIKNQPVWCSFFSPSAEYDSSQGPDKKRTVYQMALSKKSLSPLLSYCKRVL